MIEDGMKCDCCGEEISFRWTDAHGVAVCTNCGLPYRIYHYDDSEKRIEKAPEITLNPEAIEIAKEYWEETHDRVFPAIHSFFSPSSGYSYCGATPEQQQKFYDWLDERAKDEHPHKRMEDC